MSAFDLAWFKETLFGARYDTLTQAQYDYAMTLAGDDLANVLCWCPKLYPVALSIKLSLILDGAGLTAEDAQPTMADPTGSHDAYVVLSEVFDARRQYKLLPKQKQIAGAAPAAQLQAIIDKCKPPLSVGAFVARGVQSAIGRCCSGDYVADKAVPRDG